MTADVDALADRYWDLALAAEPLTASLLGDHRFDDALPDLSADGEAQRGAALRRMAAELDGVDVTALPAQQRITAEMLRFELDTAIGVIESALPEFTVAPTIVGPQAVLLEACPNLTLPEPEHAEALVTRYRRVDAYFAQAADRLRAGVAGGRTPASRAVGQVVRQIDDYLAAPVDDDPLLRPEPPPAWDPTAVDRWRAALRAALVEVVRPALEGYRDCLASEVAGVARPEERSGVSWLPDGQRVYQLAIERGTSITAEPGELHDIGRQAVADLAREYREIAGKALGTTDVADVFSRLRDDPALRFDTSQEVLDAAESALRRAEAAVPGYFGRLPVTPCVTGVMPAHEVRDGTIAYYLPPADDGTRPGTYMVNTWAPETRTRFESEALAFHEAVPGHHTQIALASELEGLPAFRRFTSVNAYVEGWALYTERLADEMGLYSGDVERLGMLAFDSWRACRLVVDTGLHAFGWSRQRAVDYLRDNSPAALNNIDNEVDRYISWPGQALGYKVGQREIFRLRALARDELGAGFDLPAFHDVVLGSGSVPLAVLDRIVSDWIAGGRSAGM